MNHLFRKAPLAPMILALVFAVSSLAARAEGDIRTERVHFAKGATSAVVEGTITATRPSTTCLVRPRDSR